MIRRMCVGRLKPAQHGQHDEAFCKHPPGIAHLQLPTSNLGTARAASGPTETPRVPDHEVLGGELFPSVHGLAGDFRRVAHAVGVPTPRTLSRSLDSHRRERRRKLVHVSEGRLQLLLSRLLLLLLPHLRRTHPFREEEQKVRLTSATGTERERGCQKSVQEQGGRAGHLNGHDGHTQPEPSLQSRVVRSGLCSCRVAGGLVLTMGICCVWGCGRVLSWLFFAEFMINLLHNQELCAPSRCTFVFFLLANKRARKVRASKPFDLLKINNLFSPEPELST